MDNSKINIISLFSGAAGLDLGVHDAIGRMGHACRTVAYVEIEAYCDELLALRGEQAWLDEAPVYTDITTFPARKFRGLVDIIIGGFPCQDLSVAGKRAGIDGERSGLWSQFARIVGEVRPRLVFIENVPGLLANEPMRRVLGDLAALGFNAEWCCVRASDVGAPHRRERVFILAYRPIRGLGISGQPSGRDGQPDGGGEGMDDAECPERRAQHITRGAEGGDAVPQRQESSGGTGVAGETVGNTERARRTETGAGGRQHTGAEPETGERAMADAGSERREGRREGRTTSRATGRGGGTDFPPGPGDRDAWQRILAERPYLAPAVKPGLRVQADGTAVVVDQHRSHQLRATGNAVCPAQATAAMIELLQRIIP